MGHLAAPETRHRIDRLRHETRRRTLTIAAIEDLTPRMRRIVFTAPALADFVSAAPDDHIKLFFPEHGADENGRACMRDFTPRAFDTEHQTLTIDFALHEAGPATSWASAAKVGGVLDIGGPRGSVVVPDDFDWYLLIGDETALPAIGRWVEALPPGTPVRTIVAVADATETQQFVTQAAWDPVWVYRDAARASDHAPLQQALAGETLPEGEGFVWIAAEASVARTLKGDVLAAGQPQSLVRASGYWKQGQADAHETL